MTIHSSHPSAEPDDGEHDDLEGTLLPPAPETTPCHENAKGEEEHVDDDEDVETARGGGGAGAAGPVASTGGGRNTSAEAALRTRCPTPAADGPESEWAREGEEASPSRGGVLSFHHRHTEGFVAASDHGEEEEEEEEWWW